jgi:F-type H+-transporting ATPase subunit b
MEEIVHTFGIDWRLIVIQIFNFGLLMGVLWYFLYTPVLRILREREALIEKGVQDAKDAAFSKDAAQSEKVTVLQKAHEEAAHIVARGTAHADERKQKTLEEADVKAKSILTKAHEEASALRDKAVRESDAELARLALLSAEKILRKELSK